MPAAKQTEANNEWTTASVRRRSLGPVQDEAHRRRKKQLDNASDRLVLDEVIQLGIEQLKRSRAT